MASFKASTLEILAYSQGISSIDLTTHNTCDQGACSVLIGIECLVQTSSTKCTADSRGNIGNNNAGSINYGHSNKGNGNIGAMVLHADLFYCLDCAHHYARNGHACSRSARLPVSPHRAHEHRQQQLGDQEHWKW